MASGKAHDFSIVVCLVPVSIGAIIYLPSIVPTSLAVPLSIVGYLVGGFFLSPDIDLKQSRPSQRLGLLSGLWKPYRQMSGHRGFSHMPIFGTLSRMFYVLTPFVLLELYQKHDFIKLWQKDRSILIPIFIGLEISAIIHLIMDYTPGLNKK